LLPPRLLRSVAILLMLTDRFAMLKYKFIRFRLKYQLTIGFVF
jgi:hypothetical protein